MRSTLERVAIPLDGLLYIAVLVERIGQPQLQLRILGPLVDRGKKALDRISESAFQNQTSAPKFRCLSVGRIDLVSASGVLKRTVEVLVAEMDATEIEMHGILRLAGLKRALHVSDGALGPSLFPQSYAVVVQQFGMCGRDIQQRFIHHRGRRMVPIAYISHGAQQLARHPILIRN